MLIMRGITEGLALAERIYRQGGQISTEEMMNSVERARRADEDWKSQLPEDDSDESE